MPEAPDWPQVGSQGDWTSLASKLGESGLETSRGSAFSALLCRRRGHPIHGAWFLLAQGSVIHYLCSPRLPAAFGELAGQTR